MAINFKIGSPIGVFKVNGAGEESRCEERAAAWGDAAGNSGEPGQWHVSLTTAAALA